MTELATADAAERAGEGLHTLTVEVPVVDVTLLEDRALVGRRATIVVPAGRSRLRIEGVAPVLVDKTLTAVLQGPGELPDGVRVRDVKIERWWVTEDEQRPARVAELEQRKRALVVDRNALFHALELLDAEMAGLQRVADQLIQEIGEDVGWGEVQIETWASALDRLDQHQRELGARRVESIEAIDRLDQNIADLERLQAATETPASRTAARLELELLNAESEHRTVELRIDYLVPGALWRPWHTARLVEPPADGNTEGKATVEFRCEGCVWQATGEDWAGVELRFSTERPSLGVAPPLLHTDRLAIRKRGSTVEVQTREQKIHTAGLGAGEQSPGVIEARDELPGIDDGGEALLLRGVGKASIPSDGRPYRVAISSFEASAETALVCTPELLAAVLLRSRQTNTGDQPLLAGPVDLVRRSGLVGRTSILFVAPGERFELGWGPDSALRVHRDVEMLEHERKTMSSWTRKPRRVRVKLSNLGPAPRTIEVTERVAVSEIEKVEVELAEAVPKIQPDRDGFATWTVRLPGFGHETLELAWTLVVHDDVVGL